MTIMTTAQARLLDSLTAAKAKYDSDEVALQKAVEAQRAINKEPIRAAIAQCVEAGIPFRQIHQRGLGMKQANQMTNFLSGPQGDRRNNLLALVNNGTIPVLTVEAAPETLPALRWDNNAVWWMEDGTEKYVARQTINPLYGKVTTMKFGKLSDFGQKVVLGDKAIRCLIGDEDKQYMNDGIVPDRYND